MAGVRCTQSNKFTSMTGDVEEPDLTINADGLITGTVKVKLVCDGCGEDLKAAVMDVEMDADSAHQCSNPTGETVEEDEEDCADCGGTGSVDAECETCQGLGSVEDEGGLVSCEDCNGNGSVEEDCENCNGTGSVTAGSGLDTDHYTLEESRAEYVERQEDTVQRGKRKGQKITNPRYMTTMRGALVTATVTCNRCETTFDVETTVEDPASTFDEA